MCRPKSLQYKTSEVNNNINKYYKNINNLKMSVLFKKSLILLIFHHTVFVAGFYVSCQLKKASRLYYITDLAVTMY